MQFANFARVRLIHGPTPLEPMPRLSAALGGPDIWIKRDDCTGLATGGNKSRKLEFLIGDALAQGCDTLVTIGATQSNHCRQTAAAAAKMGMNAVLLLERRRSDAAPEFYDSGNVLLDDLLGARIVEMPAGTDMDEALASTAERLRANGHKPYTITTGGSNPVGSLGYADMTHELLRQADDVGLRIDNIVFASGSGGTQAGILAGLGAESSSIPAMGISVARNADSLRALVTPLTHQTMDLLDVPREQCPEVLVTDAYVGPGYGLATPAMVEALRLVASTEGILLDPVYTGKAMAGLIDVVRAGQISAEQNVVFIHTGGSVGLFGYQSELT